MNKRIKPEVLQSKVNKWNRLFPVGTEVIRYKLINPLREGEKTKTRSEAWVMGGHSAMIQVEGVAGGVLLESVRPPLSSQQEPTAPTPAEAKARRIVMGESTSQPNRYKNGEPIEP